MPAIAGLVPGFLREHAPRADDPGCAGSVPEEDVAAAVTVVRGRTLPHDAGMVLDLRGTCLAGADLRTRHARGADLTGAELHDANLARTSLVGTSLFGARFAGTGLRDALFPDDTRWPPRLEGTVLAASSFATTTFVIGELVLPDPG